MEGRRPGGRGGRKSAVAGKHRESRRGCSRDLPTSSRESPDVKQRKSRRAERAGRRVLARRAGASLGGRGVAVPGGPFLSAASRVRLCVGRGRSSEEQRETRFRWRCRWAPGAA